MTRQEHMQWSKARALAYLPNDPTNAIASMVSDLGKHPETEDHAGLQLMVMLAMGGQLSTPDQVRKFIEGFN